MSSRFFKPQFDSDSESEESEAEVPTQKISQAANVAAYAFSDDEEDEKRIVRTEKEKRYEELNSIIKQIKNCYKIRDMSKMLTNFENLTKAFIKAKQVIEKEEAGVTPRFYVKCLVELETYVTQVWENREGRKNMSKNSTKSLATLRQKLRKYNKDFETQINMYKENPDEVKDDFDEEEEKSDEDSDDSEDEGGFVVKGGAKRENVINLEEIKTKAILSDDEKDSDESDWGSSSEESSLSSDYENYGESAAFKFLKKDASEAKESKKREKKKDRKEGLRRKIDDYEDDEGEWEKVKGGIVATERQKVFSKDDEINYETVVKKLNEILSLRGKKRIQRNDQINMLSELLDIAEAHKLGPAIKTKIIFGIATALMDYNTTMSNCMKPEAWEKCLEFCDRFMQIITTTPDLLFSESVSEESENFQSAPYRVHGSIVTLAERIDEEFTKILQSVDAHSPEYIERLKDETKVCKIIDLLQNYLENDSIGNSSELCRVYILKIDHLYYKFDYEVFKPKVENGVDGNKSKSSIQIMEQLCKFIYAKDTTDRIRTQAILCHIYHHALHDNWFEARDLMLMSHLQGYNISRGDVGLQIIYNRALVQLGLCAFRHGNIKDAHTGLLDIQILGRAKEFLAQGLLPKQQERTPEQERLEKRRLLPFHKHVNLELLECVYLVSAMLLEIPDVAANEYSVRKKMISRSFYNQLRKNEEQPLVGLPESMREHVVAASKAMRVGNWKACRDFIINDKMNAKVWNLFHNPDKVREMLVQKIREESLRAFLFTYSHIYDSISLDTLCQMFDLEHSTVHGIISKMIINEELMASLDEPTQTLVMHRTEPSRLQGLSLQLAEKINTLVEHNERIWEIKQTNAFGVQTNRMNFNTRQERGYMDRQQRDQRRGSQYNRN